MSHSAYGERAGRASAPTLVRNTNLPRENTAAGGVVEGVFCEARGDGVFGAMHAGVAEIQRVRGRRRPAQRGLPSLEVQVLDVERSPDIVGGGPVVIDAVGLPPLEQRDVAAQARAGRPVQARFVGPGALRT